MVKKVITKEAKVNTNLKTKRAPTKVELKGEQIKTLKTKILPPKQSTI